MVQRWHLHSDMGGERLLRADTDRVPAGLVRLHDSGGVRAQDEGVTSGKGQVLADGGVAVNVVTAGNCQWT